MKKLLLIWLAAFAAVSCAQEKQPSKPLYMWFDCEANYATLSHPDSIRYYVSKIHDMGFTDVVVDVKSIMGETLYKSDIAPYMGEWEGVTRPENYDLLGYFIEEGHKLGMRVHGSLNVFAGGHNYFDRGIIYGDHADWQSQVYTEGKIVPISEIKSNYNGMLNPANPEVQEYELAILKEFAGKYPDVDGIVFDRVRFDNITSDFSPLSKELFEAYAGTKVADYPGDILRWTQDADGKWSWSQGPLFRKWIEWRASVIKDFVTEAHRQLKEINPRLIYCSISAYGQEGPYANRPGYDVIAQAVSGMMEMTGEPDGPPNKIGSAIGDWMGALNAFGCIGTALYYRSETGEGQHIDISLARSLMWMAAKLDHGITGEMQTRTGNHHSNLAPYGIFKGRNNQSVVIGVLSSKLWETFCKVMQRTELINDPRFVSNDKRVENKQLLIEIIEDWLSNFEQVSDAIDLLMVAGVPCSKIYNMKDIDKDPHFNQCGWIADMPMADGMTTVRTRRFPSDPFKFSAFEPVYGKAPALGEQNHEVLEALGFTAEEVDEMEAEWEMKVKNK